MAEIKIKKQIKPKESEPAFELEEGYRPIKSYLDKSPYYFKCGCCERHIASRDYAYCPHCGEHIIWGAINRNKIITTNNKIYET